MTEKKSIFIKYALMTDIMMSLIFFLNLTTIQRLGTLYLPLINLASVISLAPALLIVSFVFLRRLRIKNYQMIFLHVTVIAVFLTAVYFISSRDIWIMVHMVVASVAGFVYSMSHRYKINEKATGRVGADTLYISLGIHIIALPIFAYSQKSSQMAEFSSPIVKQPQIDVVSLILLNAVFIIILYFAARQLDVFENSYYHNLHSSTQPVGRIRRQNNLTICLVIGGIFFSLGVLALTPMDTLTNMIRDGILYIIAVIARFIIGLLQKSPDIQRLGEGDNSLELDLPDEGESNPVMEKIMMIFCTLAVIAIAIFCFYLIINWMMRLFRNFTHAADHEIVTEDKAITDLVEKIKPEEKERHIRRDFGKGHEREIRKKFYVKMRRGISDGLPISASSSPGQIRDMLRSGGDHEIDGLTVEYEKVRYDRREE